MLEFWLLPFFLETLGLRSPFSLYHAPPEHIQYTKQAQPPLGGSRAEMRRCTDWAQPAQLAGGGDDNERQENKAEWGPPKARDPVGSPALELLLYGGKGGTVSLVCSSPVRVKMHFSPHNDTWIEI